MSSAPCKGNTLIIRLLPLQGVGGVWVPFTQGAALGYVLMPLRGVLFMSFDTLTSKQELHQYSSVGALLALASGKAERRQVHPLKAPSAVQSDSLKRY